MKKCSLPIYTISHLLVDLICFLTLFGRYDGLVSSPLVGFLAYNVVAFGLQPLLGHINDVYKKLPLGAIGCLLLAIGALPFELLLPNVSEGGKLLSVTLSLGLCALGNAMFHVGGGIDTLVKSGGKMWKSGVFVSTGAIGVALGTLFADALYSSESIILFLLPSAVALLLAAAICLLCRPETEPEYAKADMDVSNGRLGTWLVIALCFFSIAIRSYGGSLFSPTWKSGLWLALLPALCAAAGKASGGFIADKLGARTVGVISLLLSVPLFFFGRGNILISAAGIILFNMSMSITLAAIYSRLQNSPGLAFGITTLALLLGSLPLAFFAVGGQTAAILTAALTIVSAACLVFSLKGLTQKANRSAEEPYAGERTEETVTVEQAEEANAVGQAEESEIAAEAEAAEESGILLDSEEVDKTDEFTEPEGFIEIEEGV